jgi:hypothetical protein
VIWKFFLLRGHYKVFSEEYSKEGLIPCTVLKAETIFFTCVFRKVTLNDTSLVPYIHIILDEEMKRFIKFFKNSTTPSDFQLMALEQLFWFTFEVKKNCPSIIIQKPEGVLLCLNGTQHFWLFVSNMLKDIIFLYNLIFS